MVEKSLIPGTGCPKSDTKGYRHTLGICVNVEVDKEQE